MQSTIPLSKGFHHGCQHQQQYQQCVEVGRFRLFQARHEEPGLYRKSDLQSALSATDDSGSTQSSDVDDAFSALDGDGDGKVTKSELTDAMTKLSDQLNAQFHASCMSGGSSSSTASATSTSSINVEA
jgi:Ca2+-binding EF-hand superfamily protein